MTTNAIALALQHNIDIGVVNGLGHPKGRFWHSKLGSTAKIRKEKLEASLNEIGLKTIKSWLSQKLENQADFLQDLKKHRKQLRDFLDDKSESILEFRQKIQESYAENINEKAGSCRGW